MKSLQKRIREDDLIVMKTDKSSKLVVTDKETYKKMGEEHTKKDREVSKEEVEKMEKCLNSHTVAWSVMFRSGQDHDHEARIISSKTSSSGNVSSLYLMYKDHKPGNKTRPVATGHSSNTIGLSNAISEVTEAVSRTEEDPYNVVSSEDMLARMHKATEKIIARREASAEEEKKTHEILTQGISNLFPFQGRDQFGMHWGHVATVPRLHWFHLYTCEGSFGS